MQQEQREVPLVVIDRRFRKMGAGPRERRTHVRSTPVERRKAGSVWAALVENLRRF